MDPSVWSRILVYPFAKVLTSQQRHRKPLSTEERTLCGLRPQSQSLFNPNIITLGYGSGRRSYPNVQYLVYIVHTISLLICNEEKCFIRISFCFDARSASICFVLSAAHIRPSVYFSNKGVCSGAGSRQVLRERLLNVDSL